MEISLTEFVIKLFRFYLAKFRVIRFIFYCLRAFFFLDSVFFPYSYFELMAFKTVLIEEET